MKESLEGHCFPKATSVSLQPSFPAGQQDLDMKWRRVRPDSCLCVLHLSVCKDLQREIAAASLLSASFANLTDTI